MRLARESDGAAFEELIAPHQGVMLSLAQGILSSRVEAEDAHQEALLRFARKIPAVASARELRAYLCRLAINEARRARMSRWLRLAPARAAELPEVASSAPSPERHAHYVQIHERVTALVPRLTRRERQVFLLRAFDDLDYPEIATLLGIGEVTARRLFSLARQRMERLLRDEHGVEVGFPD